MDINKIQEDLDLKKWYDSLKQNRDTCGDYAYCAYCQIDMENPCANAMLKSEEMAKKSAVKASAKTADKTAKPVKREAVAEAAKAEVAAAVAEPAKKAPAKKSTKKTVKSE